MARGCLGHRPLKRVIKCLHSTPFEIPPLQSPASPENETQRLKELYEFQVLDSGEEILLDELTELASNICDVPIALISLIDENRQWFKSRVGLDVSETGRDISFCGHAILQEGLFEINDAREDERFRDNPLVTGEPHIRFYAGAPLVTRRGQALGTLCVIDREPRELSDHQRRSLRTLAKVIVKQLELRLQRIKSQQFAEEREQFFAILAHDLRSPFTSILGLSRLLKQSVESLDAEQTQEIADQLLSSSMSLFQLLDELLQRAQSNMSDTDYDLEENHLRVLLDDALQLLQEAMDIKGIQLSDTVSDGHLIMVDAALTKTVFRNIISNAIKFSPSESHIRLSTRDEGDFLCLRVEDEGPGIDDALADRLFSQQVASRAGSKGEIGFGLGLKLCYSFMQMQGGDLRLDRDYDKGTAIEILLPRAGAP